MIRKLRLFRAAEAPAPDKPGTGSLEALRARYSEICRQESRADGKSIQVLTQTGILATLATAGAGGLALVSPWLGVRVLLAVIPLVIAIIPWGWAMLVVLRQVIRPKLGDDAFSASKNHTDEAEFYADTIAVLRPIVLARYRSIAFAVDLQVTGLLFSGLALLVLGVVGVIHGLRL